MSNGTTVEERLPRLLVELQDMRGQWDVNDPHRFAKHRMQQAAYAALESGMRVAAEIIEAGKLLRDASPQTGDGT